MHEYQQSSAAVSYRLGGLLGPCCGLLLLLSSLLSGGQAHAKRPYKPLELRPILGYGWVNLTGISQEQFLSTAAMATPEQIASADEQAVIEAAKVPVQGSGPAGGLGIDLRLWVFSLGGQYTYTHAGDFGLHTGVVNLGLRLGGTVAFYTRLGGGYARQLGLPEGLSTGGFVVSSSNGFDIRLSNLLSLDLGVDGELLMLTRNGQLDGQAQLLSGNVNQETAAKVDGSAVGYQIRPMLGVTFHL